MDTQLWIFQLSLLKHVLSVRICGYSFVNSFVKHKSMFQNFCGYPNSVGIQTCCGNLKCGS